MVQSVSMADRRTELLNRIADHLAENGLADLSVRGLADAVGTSHRMLLYYFGSKDELLRSLYRALRDRLIALPAARSGATFGEAMLETWETLKNDARGFSAVQALTGMVLLDPERYFDIAHEHTDQLLATIRDGLLEAGVPEGNVDRVSTLVLATVRGLQTTWRTTRDRARVDQGWRDLVTLIEDVFIPGDWPSEPVPHSSRRRRAARSRRK